MSGPNDLDDLLNSSEGEPEVNQPQETVEHREPAPEPTGEKQQSAAPPADAQPVVEDAGSWTKQAVLDERRKRQELEKKLAEFEARLQPQQPQPQPQQEQPDWFASPEQAAQVMQAQFAESMFQTRVATSERILKKEYEDYDEVSTLFAEHAKRDPNLLQQLYHHPFPAEFAYQVGQQIKLIEEIKDPKSYREKVRAELLAEMQSGDNQRSQAPATSKPPVPRSLARDVSTQPRTQTGQFTGPTPLDELLG